MEHFSQQLEPRHLSQDMLNEYLDGYLTPDAAVQMEHHLSICPTCNARYHQLQRLFADLEGLSDITWHRDISRDVVQVINTKLQIPGIVKWTTLPQLAISLFVLFALLPKYLPGWLAVLPKAVNMSLDIHFIDRIAQSMAWVNAIRFLPSAWQFSSLNLNFQFQALNHINWLLFAVVFALLLIANGYLLREIARNGSQ